MDDETAIKDEKLMHSYEEYIENWTNTIKTTIAAEL